MKAPLTQRFKQHECHAVAQIQRTRCRIEHGNSQPCRTIRFEQRFWEPSGFATEHKIVVRTKLSVRVQSRAVRFDKPQPRVGRNGLLELSERFPAVPFHMLPVIHPCPLQLGIVQLESERFNQMQRAPRSRAKPGNVPGVRRNLRLNQDNMHHRILETLPADHKFSSRMASRPAGSESVRKVYPPTPSTHSCFMYWQAQETGEYPVTT
jgi:hypothetical protein